MTNSMHKIHGIVARFEDTAELFDAAQKTHQAGYRKFDCHSPFPIHGMDKAMGLKRSGLGWLVGLSGLVGSSGALLLQWWSGSIENPLIISGKPLFSYQAYLPVTFAVGVLLAAFTALFGMLILNGLPRFNHPIFYSDNFIKASDDSFFVSIESNDTMFDLENTSKFLESIGGKDIEILRGKP